MKSIVITDSKNAEIKFSARWAKTIFRRLIGLLATSSLKKNEGLLLSPCKSVHTMGMSYPLDLIFMDKQRIVVKCVQNLKPYRAASAKRAYYTLELPINTIEASGVGVGDQFSWSSS